MPPQEHENRPNRWSVGCTTRSTSPLSAHFRGRHQRVRLFTLLPSTEVPDRSRTLGVSEIAGQYRTFPIRTEGCAMFRPAAPLCDGLPPPRRLARPAHPGEPCVPQSAPFERPVAVGRWPEGFEEAWLDGDRDVSPASDREGPNAIRSSTPLRAGIRDRPVPRPGWTCRGCTLRTP